MQLRPPSRFMFKYQCWCSVFHTQLSRKRAPPADPNEASKEEEDVSRIVFHYFSQGSSQFYRATHNSSPEKEYQTTAIHVVYFSNSGYNLVRPPCLWGNPVVWETELKRRYWFPISHPLTTMHTLFQMCQTDGKRRIILLPQCYLSFN